MPAFGLSDRTLETLRGILAKCPAVEQAIIHGPRATGTFRPSSGIDLSLCGHELNAQSLSAIARWLHESDIPYLIDLSLHKLIENPELLAHIAQHGIVLYQRAPVDGPCAELKPHIIHHLQQHIPGLLAIYAFGSRITGHSGPESDLDLAVLCEGHAYPMQLLTLAGELSDIVHCPVDLLDLRKASTVMQYQILMHGTRWWAADCRAGSYEATLLNQKTQLDEARRDLLNDILREGKIHGG